MDENTKKLIASNLTAAFYTGQIRREPYLGEERRKDVYKAGEKDRTPTVSLDEVMLVYHRFLQRLDIAESESNNQEAP